MEDMEELKGNDGETGRGVNTTGAKGSKGRGKLGAEGTFGGREVGYAGAAGFCGTGTGAGGGRDAGKGAVRPWLADQVSWAGLEPIAEQEPGEGRGTWKVYPDVGDPSLSGRPRGGHKCGQGDPQGVPFQLLLRLHCAGRGRGQVVRDHLGD